jgi:hypothetical protein
MVEGAGVRQAEEIAAEAPTGQVWVSPAAGMLLSGSGLQLLPVASEDAVAGQQLLRAIA